MATKVFAILWLPIFLLSVPPLGPMFLKVPLSQPWLKISGDGLDYGGRIRVPWTAVSAIRPHKVAIVRRRRNSFVLPGWKPPGRIGQRPAAFVENHFVIPDELQRSVEGLQELADPLTHDGALPGTPRHQSGELLADCRR